MQVWEWQFPLIIGDRAIAWAQRDKLPGLADLSRDWLLQWKTTVSPSADLTENSLQAL